MVARAHLAAACHGLVGAGLVVFGLRYVLADSWMSYHEEVVGLPWEAVPPPMSRLLLALIRGAGVATAAGGLALLLLLAIPWRRGERWAIHGLPLLGLAGTVPLLWITVDLAGFGAGTPWPAVASAITLLIAGWGLSFESGSARPRDRAGADGADANGA